jgi:ketosteroid isomerase-like protein
MFVGDDSGVVVAHKWALRYGEEVTADYAEVFQISDGKVSRMDVYPLSFDAMTNFYK